MSAEVEFDWPALWAGLEPLPSDAERERVWRGHGHRWLSKIVAVLGGDFALHEVGGFWVVSSQHAKYVERVGRLLQGARRRILADLDGIARDPLHSRLAVLWLDNEEIYYDYISRTYPDAGEFAFSGGSFLSGGYPHFVFPHYEEFRELERLMSHELTHALVSHLPLPLWLNEGIAVTMEEVIAGGWRARGVVEMLKEYPGFWNEETIQEFWSGRSFSRGDEGNGLSYGLAHLLALNFAHDFDRFRGFTLAANAADAGESAARNHLGISLGDMVGALLGEGDWVPKPERWVRERSEAASTPAMSRPEVLR